MATQITRRQTLQMLAGSALLSSGILSGCAGLFGGGSSSAVQLVKAVGNFTLPPGFPIPLAELVAENGWDSQPLNPNGTFPTKQLRPSRPTAAILRHTTTDKFVLGGIVGGGSSGVSAKGSAVLLIALALGVFSLPAAAGAQAIALIEDLPAADTLAQVIASKIVIDPYALFEGNGQINGALSDALAAIGNLRANLERGPKGADEILPLILIQQGDQSNARVVQGESRGTIQAVNLARRPVTAYTYQIANIDENGGRSDLPSPRLVGGAQHIDPTSGIIGTLSNLSSASLFAPVYAPPVRLGVDAGYAKSEYQTIMLMASAQEDGVAADPAFYSDPRYASLVEEWRNERGNLNIQASLGGVLYQIIGSVIGGVSGFASSSAAVALVSELEAIQAGTASIMVAAARAGRYGAVVQEALELAVAGDFGPSVRYILADFVVKAEGASAHVAALYARGAAIRAIALLCLGALATAGALVGLAEAGFLFSDIVNSNKGERWDITALKPRVRISPDTLEMARGGSQVFTGAVIGFTGGNFLYKWRLSGSNLATIQDAANPSNIGNEIETTGNAITLATTPSTQGTLTITLEVFQVEGSNRTSVGTDTANVTMIDRPVELPASYSARSGVLDGRGRAVAVVSWQRIGGVSQYRLIGTGGNDPAYFGTSINFVVSANQWPDAQEEPYGIIRPANEVWVGLSGWDGPESGTAGAVAWLDSRFSGFTFVAQPL